MNDLRIGEMDLLTLLKPDSIIGALVYFLIFVVVALLLSRILRATVHAAITRQSHFDRTTASFLAQFGSALVWIVALILYAQLIPQLRALGAALLAGASIASVVIGLAAQSTLGNLVAGIAITIYKPFRLGDTLQVAAPTGTEVGVVDAISLGYTTLLSSDGHRVVLPNSIIAASQVSLNLSHRNDATLLSVFIEVPRETDLAVIRAIVSEVVKPVTNKAVTNKSVNAERRIAECFLTRVDNQVCVLEVKLNAKSTDSPESIRSDFIAFFNLLMDTFVLIS